MSTAGALVIVGGDARRADVRPKAIMRSEVARKGELTARRGRRRMGGKGEGEVGWRFAEAKRWMHLHCPRPALRVRRCMPPRVIGELPTALPGKDYKTLPRHPLLYRRIRNTLYDSTLQFIQTDLETHIFPSLVF